MESAINPEPDLLLLSAKRWWVDAAHAAAVDEVELQDPDELIAEYLESEGLLFEGRAS
jgi:hypothetical protein